MAGLFDFFGGGQDAGGPGLLGNLRGALNQIADPEGLQKQRAFQNNLALREQALKEQIANRPQLTQLPGVLGSTPAWANPNNQTITVPKVEGQGAGNPLVTGQDANGNALSGEDFLKTQPIAVQNLIKGLANYDYDIGKLPVKGDARTQLLAAVQTYDPSWNASDYATRYATRKSFTSGPDAGNITALNTVVGHMLDLKKAGDTLNNFGSPLVNKPINTFESAVMGDPRYNNFDLKRNAVADELAKVFRNTGSMSDSEVNQWKATLNNAQSPDQINGAIDSALKLMESRLGALGQKYQQGMGKTINPIELLSPEARAGIAQLRGQPAGNTTVPTPAGALPTATPTMTPAASVPQAAVQALRAQPKRAAEFDAKYGPGSAARILGQ